MLNILKERLIDGLKIVSVKEQHSKYKIEFDFEGDRAKAELPKSCAPGYHNEIVDHTIITAMSTIYMNRGDYEMARAWLNKLVA